MTENLTSSFDKATELSPKDYNVLVLGAGLMGKRHIQSLLEIAQKVLEPRYGVSLQVAAVDGKEDRLAALPDAVTKFKSLDAALAAQKPDIVLMAFNDDQHAQAFKKLFAVCPDIQAVLSEKPLTETLAEAHEIEPELRKRYLSMNTVINFSPVFDRIHDIMPALTEKYGALDLTGFEGVWGKNRTGDSRPSIGIQSDCVHALSIVTDMFNQDGLVMERGKGLAGYLSDGAKDVVYEMESSFVSPTTNKKMNFHASYVFAEQERRVTAYYQTKNNSVLAFEMEFDVKVDGENKDSLKLYEIDVKTGQLTLLVDEYPDHIINGVEQGLLRNDRVTAFNSLSLLDFLPAVSPLAPDITKRLGLLDTALEIQGMVEQINANNPVLAVQRVDVDKTSLHTPIYPKLAMTDDKSRLVRLKNLSHQAPVSAPQAKMKP
jgi:predicted dehydrogenase